MINKIKNNIFFKSTLILLLGGIIGKCVGFFIKIIVTRNLGTHGMGLYSLLNPSIALITTIATFSYPTGISALVSRKKYDSKTLIYSITIVSFLINLIFIILICLFSSFISSYLLKESSLKLPIIFASFTLPFVSISSIIKGYFWGKQNMYPYMLSNFLEQVGRIILIGLFIKKFISISPSAAICFILCTNMICEVLSQFVMLRFKPKEKINIFKLKFNLNYIKDLFKICIPSTSSKILGSIAYFFEPIILSNTLLYLGYSNEYIVYEYGVINAYALSLLLLPAFFVQNMSTALVPEVSYQYSLKNYETCKKRIRQIVLISLLIGSISTLVILINPKFFLNLIYNTNLGSDYIRLLGPFTILFYIEGPLISALGAINKAKSAMIATIISSLVRLISIVVFSFLGLGMYSLIIAIILNIITSVLIYFIVIHKALKS